MANHHEEFYIIQRDSGQALFHQSFSTAKYDPDLFAGLFTAILQYAKVYSNKDIADFEMKKKIISIGTTDKYPILYIYIVDKEVVKKKKKIKKMLNLVKKEFEKAYDPEIITNWNGNITIFKPFRPRLDEILHPWKSFEEFGI